MNIHLPAILGFTRGTIGFDTLPCFFDKNHPHLGLEAGGRPQNPSPALAAHLDSEAQALTHVRLQPFPVGPFVQGLQRFFERPDVAGKYGKTMGKIWGNNHENGRFNENIMRTDYSKTCWYALIRHVSLAGLESGFWPTQNWDVEEKLVIKR